MTMNFGWKHAMFGKTPDARELAEKELKNLDLQALHYSNELLLIQKHVSYINDRRRQLKADVERGAYYTQINNEEKPNEN